MAANLNDEQRRAIAETLFEGRKIAAIKQYREATGASLKDAKDAIDSLALELYEEMPERFSWNPREQKAGCGAALCAMLLLTSGMTYVLWT